ncbi:molybdate ABC transporter substrate-binding protein [Staphylococcus simulans]|uniref:molybdate ABC transporter substrate-binding protein n=1 Tax=Staphylococcus simulans TaxID=1286 RepID=UPI001E405DC0|nr:molybdate ABC transporter substrate-binding protein [Staphylococcus simulans]MCD8915764.1 molybdate ABC transporter substrate-binding protein [Staphylococcus simulans]
MKLKSIVTMLCIIGLVLAGCANQKQSDSKSKEQTLHVAAAASLTDVTKDLEQAFKKQHPDAKVTFNYGGSGALRQQIEKGAPVDVLMSANKKDVQALKDKKQADHVYDYAKNNLVLIGEKGTKAKSVNDLKPGDKLAIGEVKSVPAGKYAESYLKANGLYKGVQDQLVFAKDVRQVLNYVEKGNAQLGFVYQTDLYQNKTKDDKVKAIQQVQLKEPIVYEAGTTSDNQLGKAWIEFLKSDEAKKILRAYHFEA